MAFYQNSSSAPTPVNERIIYVIVVQGQIVRGYANYKMALQDLEKIRAIKPNVEIADPVPVKLYDDRALGYGIGDRVQTGWN